MGGAARRRARAVRRAVREDPRAAGDRGRIGERLRAARCQRATSPRRRPGASAAAAERGPTGPRARRVPVALAGRSRRAGALGRPRTSGEEARARGRRVTRTPRATDPLLASEIERRVALFGDPSTPHVTLRAALHALVGSVSMAGHTDLALVISQGGARLAEGDEQARFELFGVLSSAASRLRAGEEPFATRWPEPPPALRASRVEPSYRVEYFRAVRDRLGQLDAALSSTDALSALEQAQRSVHTLKGAASAVGDDVTAWYC